MTDAHKERNLDRPHRVLIIEDSDTMRHVCHETLTSAGLDVATSSTAEEGFYLLETAFEANLPFDGLLLDWVLPKMSGAQLMQKIMNDARFITLSIMVFTEEPNTETYNLVRQRQNNDIQHKSDLKLLPFRMQRFLNTFNNHELGTTHPLAIPTSSLDEQDDVLVLVVDDAPTVREVYRDLLKSNGYSVLTASSKNEGLQIARQSRPALAIIDYFMPEGNGDEMVSAMVQDPLLSNILPVMFSSSQREDIIQKSLAAGAIDVILKDDPSHVFLMRIAAMSRVLRAERKAKIEVATKAVYARELELRLEATKSLEAVNNQLAQQNEELALTKELLEEKAHALTQTNKYKSEFLANVSHELRTPLNSMLLLSRLFTENRKGNLNDDQIKYADTIHKAGKDLLKLINEVLDLSKIEAGKLDLDFTTVNISQSLASLEARYRPMAVEKGIDFELSIEPGLPKELILEGQRFEQIVTNFLSNAIKFTHEGKVTLEAGFTESTTMISDVRWVAGEVMQITVRDTGIGIPEAQHREIFEAFEQGEGGTSRTYGGTGLGLSIVSNLCSVLGWGLSVASEVKQGSSFSVLIPMLVDPGSNQDVTNTNMDQDKPRRASKNPRSKSSKLLLVDDNVRNLYALTAALQSLQFDIETATTGVQALAYLENHSDVDVVLMDIMMPEMDGYEAIRRIRANQATHHLPVIAITANAMTGARDKCLEVGATGYVSKPIDIDLLTDVLTPYLPSKAS
ncbi:MAG: response regulator [Myxococcota bacterium]|nr:response regulator [Myxococcota bacterium]